MCDVERFGLALLEFVAKSSKHKRGPGFEIASFNEDAKKLFIAIARGEHCASKIAQLPSIRERATLVYWLHLRRFADPGIIEYFDTVNDTEAHFKNFESAILNSAEYKEIGRFDLPREMMFDDATSRPPQLFIDISNTVNTRTRTGIQRVVREVGQLLSHSGDATLIYTNRKLSKFVKADLDALDPSHRVKFDDAQIVTFRKGDLYFDVDASWGEPSNRFTFYAHLKAAGVRIITMHHDAVPILFPHFSHNDTVGRFIEHFLATTTFSDRIICNSEAVRHDFEELCRRLEYRAAKASVIRLGSDFTAPRANSKLQPETIDVLNSGPYALCVGTVEPRKNYGAVLACLPKLRELELKLVIVGKVGWEEPEVIQALDEASANENDLVWLKSADDTSLHELYKKCRFLIAASFYEGFGLPIVEGLSRGCLIISSDGGALPEVLDSRGVVFALAKPGSLANALEIAARDESLSSELLDRVEKFIPASWQDTISDLSVHFADFFGPVVARELETIQLVYISIRPNDLKRSLNSFKDYLQTPISNVVVLTDAAHRQEINAILNSTGLSAKVLLDEDLLAETAISHAERNFALRSSLYASEHLEEIFLALDDDSVLLRPVAIDHFQSNEKTTAFCTYPSMRKWRTSPFAATSYDDAQWRTGDVLSEFGYPDRAFAAHQPQLIVKRLAREIFAEVASLPDRRFDGWSVYFNIAVSRYCEGFKILRSTTLFWPDRLNSWQPEWFNDDIFFESYCANNYESGGIAFENGISQTDDWRIKRTAYSSEYNKYYFQELLDVSFENISASVVESLGDPIFSNDAVVGFANLWKPVVTACADQEQITYEIRLNSVMIVHGVEPQIIGRTRPLYVKCPPKPGTYELALFKRGRHVSQTRLLILPLGGNQTA